MPPEIVYRCTICQTERRQTNHWWVYFVSASFELMTWSDAQREGYLNDDRARYACGAEHVTTAFNRFLMDSVSAVLPTIEAPPPRLEVLDSAGPFVPKASYRPAPSTECHSTSSGSQLPDAPGDRPESPEPRESPLPATPQDGQTDCGSVVSEHPEHGLTGIV